MSALPDFNLSEYIRFEVDVPAPNGNLILNPSGQYGTWFWPTPAGGLLTADETDLTYTKQSGGVYYFSTDFMPVEASKYVAARFDLTALSAGTGVRARVIFYDIDKVAVGSLPALSSTFTTLGTKFVGPNQAPAGTAYVKLGLYFYKSDGTTQAANGDTFSFNRAMVTWRDTNDFSATYTNLITNPSFESALTGWTSEFTSSFTRVSTAPYVGSWHANGVKAIGSNGATMTSPSFPVTPGTQYTASAYLRSTGSTGGGITMRFYDSGGTYLESSAASTGSVTTTYQRKSVTHTAPVGAATANIMVTTLNTPNVSVPMYVDAVMVTEGSTLRDYFDGNTTDTASAGYSWTGTANLSTSTAALTEFEFVEPGNWFNLFNDTSSLSWERRPLDVGLLSADIETDAPIELDILRNGQAVRVSVLTNADNWEPQYVGTITDWQITYNPKTRVQIQAADAINRLTSFASKFGVGQSAELAWLMEGAGVPWSIDGDGNQLAAAPTYVSSNDNATLLDQIAITRDSRNAYACVTRRGVLEIRDLTTPTDFSHACTFTDADTATAWNFHYDTDMQIGESSSDVINHVMVKYLRFNDSTDTTEEVVYGPYRDETSIAKYGPRSAEYTVHGITETAVPTWAAGTLALTKDAVQKPSVLRVPVRTSTGTAPDLYMCLLDLNWIVAFKYKDFTGDYMITSIRHEINPGSWNIYFGFDKEDGVASPTVKPTIKPNYTTTTPYAYRWKTGGVDQNITNNVLTRLTFQENSAKSTGITYGSNQFTVQRAGRYHVDVSCNWDSNATGIRRLRLFAGELTTDNVLSTGATANGTNAISKVVRLDTGDTIYAEVIQNSGATRTVQGAQTNTSFNVTWIGD